MLELLQLRSICAKIRCFKLLPLLLAPPQALLPPLQLQAQVLRPMHQPEG